MCIYIFFLTLLKRREGENMYKSRHEREELGQFFLCVGIGWKKA